MAVDLFGWNTSYVDKYAGMSISDKYRKLVSKANVEMVLGKQIHFSKSRASKVPTKTIISYEGSNIKNTNAPIEFYEYENKIFVNNKRVTEFLDNFPKEEQEKKFINIMKCAYIARAEKESIISRFIKNPGKNLESKAEEYELQYKGMIEVQRQVAVAAQAHIYGIHNTTGIELVNNDATKMKSMDLAYALLSGKAPKDNWAQFMMARLSAMDKKRASYNKWIDDFKNQCELDASTTYFDYSQGDDYDEILSDMVPLSRYFYDTPNDKGKEEVCEVGDGKMQYSKKPEFAEKHTKGDVEYSPTNDVISKDEISKNDINLFFYGGKKQNRNDESWLIRDANAERLAEALYESLVGKMGKIKSQNPAKKLNTRAISSDISDNIYIYKKMTGGKNLSINVIVDTSGSMDGNHIESAVDIVNCFNKLSNRGVIKCNLIMSCTGASAIMPMPIDPLLVKSISAHNGGEGIKHTMAIRWKELKEADFNIAITDGMLTDGEINKKSFEKEGIFITGLYVNSNIEKKNVANFTGSLSRWFSNSAVRSTVEEAVYYLIDNALLNYDMKRVS